MIQYCSLDSHTPPPRLLICFPRSHYSVLGVLHAATIRPVQLQVEHVCGCNVNVRHRWQNLQPTGDRYVTILRNSMNTSEPNDVVAHTDPSPLTMALPHSLSFSQAGGMGARRPSVDESTFSFNSSPPPQDYELPRGPPPQA